MKAALLLCLLLAGCGVGGPDDPAMPDCTVVANQTQPVCKVTQ